jgi:hypothetical protein
VGNRQIAEFRGVRAFKNPPPGLSAHPFLARVERREGRGSFREQ